MSNQWIVFGGWGFSAKNLVPLFGEQSTYFDTSDFIHIHFRESTFDNWEDILSRHFSQEKHIQIAGWSLGAIVAAGITQVLKPKSLVLLSPTLSFCRNKEHPSGWRSSVVRSMRESLRNEPLTVLNKFAHLCGANVTPDNSCSTEALVVGLSFLESVCLTPDKLTNTKITCIHGIDDKVIVPQAGAQAARALGGSFTELSGGHLFFKEHETQIQTTINNLQ